MNRAECLAAGSQQTGGYPGISLQGDRSHLGRERDDDDDDDDCFYTALFSALEQTHCARM